MMMRLFIWPIFLMMMELVGDNNCLHIAQGCTMNVQAPCKESCSDQL